MNRSQLKKYRAIKSVGKVLSRPAKLKGFASKGKTIVKPKKQKSRHSTNRVKRGGMRK